MKLYKLPTSLFLFASLLAATVFIWLGYKRPVTGIDDANIYFVYMRNFAEGHGFVWTVGGERVEGFTSLLWTLIGALFYKIDPRNYPLLLLGLNFILIFFTLRRLLLFIKKLNGVPSESFYFIDILTAAMLFFPLGFIEWNILNLMETGLWTFLIVNATLSICDSYLRDQPINPFRFGILLIALVLTRPEGLFVGFALTALLSFGFLKKGLWKALRSVALPFALYLLGAAGLILWRLSYFGYPFPNTYYAKVSGNFLDNLPTGITYFFKLFYTYPHIAFLFACILTMAGLIAIRHFRSRFKELVAAEKIHLLLTCILLALLVLPALSGGDHFMYSRFYQPVVPIFIAAFFNLRVYRIYFPSLHLSRQSVPFLTAAAVAALFFMGKSTWIDFKLEPLASGHKIFVDFRLVQEGRAAAESMNKAFIEKNISPRVGLIAAGGFGYVYKGETVDLMGLNNTLMAHMDKRKSGPRNHASFDKKGFWILQPDVLGTMYGAEIVTDSASYLQNRDKYTFTRDQFTYEVYKGIFDDADFINNYVPALVRTKDSPFLFAYYKKAFLAKLPSSGFDVILLPRKKEPAI